MSRPAPSTEALAHARQLAREAGVDPDLTLIAALVYSDLADITLTDAARVVIDRKVVTP